MEAEDFGEEKLEKLEEDLEDLIWGGEVGEEVGEVGGEV